MFYRNSKVYNNKMDYKEYAPISFDKNVDFEKASSEFGACKLSYNFDYKDGCLIDGIGIGEFKEKYSFSNECVRDVIFQNKSIRNCYFRRVLNRAPKQFWAVMMLIDTSYNFYYYLANEYNATLTKIDQLSNIDINNVATIHINGAERLAFMDTSHTVHFWEPHVSQLNITTSPTFPTFRSMCTHNNRIYLVEFLDNTNQVLYSEDYNTYGLNLGNKYSGCINMNDNYGKAVKVFVFKDEVYIVRRHALSRVVQKKDKVALDYENIFCTDSVIEFDTVAICDDKVIFMSTDGMYEFDGRNVKNIPCEYFDKIEKVNMFDKGAYSNGFYYLSCRLEWPDNDNYMYSGYGEQYINSVITYEVKTGKFRLLRGIHIVSFVPVVDDYNAKMGVVYLDGSNSRLFGEFDNSGNFKSDSVKKKWTSKQYDFGDANNYKYIKQMKLITNADVTVNLYFDNKVKLVKLTGKSTMQTIKINQKTKLFGFGFESNSNKNKISNIKFLVGKL